MTDEAQDLETTTVDAGTDTATQLPESTESNAAESGTGEATPTEATNPAPTTTDQRSESADELLARAVRPGAAIPTQPVVNAGAPANPYAHLSPDFQKALADPAEAKRIQGLNDLYGRQAQELGHLRQQTQAYQGLPPADQLRALLERQQQQAETAKLKPWSKASPEYSRTNERIQKARMLQQAHDSAQTLPEDQRNTYLGNLAKQWNVSNDDIKLMREFDTHKDEIQTRLATDFEGLFQEHFQSNFADAMERKQSEWQAQQGAQQFINNPQVGELLSKHQDAVLWGMNHPARREVGLRLAALEAENAKLRESAKADVETVATAKARDAVTKGRAVTKRDAVTNDGSIGNVYDRAVKNKTPDQDFLKELYKVRGIE